MYLVAWYIMDDQINTPVDYWMAFDSFEDAYSKYAALLRNKKVESVSITIPIHSSDYSMPEPFAEIVKGLVKDSVINKLTKT